MSYMKDILQALHDRACAEHNNASMNVKMMAEHPVGIGEHGDIMQEVYDQLKKMEQSDSMVHFIDKMLEKTQDED
tara:strand:- start:430 stop:654 length:225 start_codon:yes stop_codon:yes gene_type:complete